MEKMYILTRDATIAVFEGIMDFHSTHSLGQAGRKC